LRQRGVSYRSLREGLVEELSLLLVPVVGGRTGTPVLFNVDTAPRRLVFQAVERREADVLWLRYRVELG
jgi:2,5-diamino-6-(ribosylamino)-4(3H)-pyrimidinone 5'-phosphate reductase